jgi:dTDP-glucose 4,6-dehydratase
MGELLDTQGWTGTPVLVTGGTGFLGRHLTQCLVALGAKVTVALREDESLEEINDPFIAPDAALRVNLHGTVNLLRACTSARVRRIVVVGTSYEYGSSGELDPGNVYAASKVAAWAFSRMYYRAYGVPVVVARPFNVYGPGQNAHALIPSAVAAAVADQNFPTTPGEQERDFIYVQDVILGFLAAACAEGIEGRSVDLGTGHATPVRDVVRRIFALTGSRGEPQIGALSYRPGVVHKLVADAEKAARMTGWHATTSLEEGLHITIDAACAGQVEIPVSQSEQRAAD